MAGIPSWAIELYDNASGGSLITSGPSGTVVYARLSSPFTENLTGLDRMVILPYCGRTALSGTKNITCNGDIKPITVNLPATTKLFNDADSPYGLSTLVVEIEQGVGAWNPETLTLGLAEEAAIVKFTFYDNAWLTGIKNNELNAVVTASDFYSDSLLVAASGFDYTYQVVGDPGRVCAFPVTFKLHIPANSGGFRDLGRLAYSRTTGESDPWEYYYINIEQD